LCWIYLEIYVW